MEFGGHRCKTSIKSDKIVAKELKIEFCGRGAQLRNWQKK